MGKIAFQEIIEDYYIFIAADRRCQTTCFSGIFKDLSPIRGKDRKKNTQHLIQQGFKEKRPVYYNNSKALSEFLINRIFTNLVWFLSCYIREAQLGQRIMLSMC
jgi:hypothetical protein